MPALASLDVGGIIKGAGEALDGLFTSAEERMQGKAILQEVENKLIAGVLEYEQALDSSRRDIILAEINSQSWMTKNWRPMLMFIIMTIIINKYIIYQYLRLLVPEAPELDLPAELWGVMKISVGGYIVGRTSEKVVSSIKATKSGNSETPKDQRLKRKLLKLQQKLGISGGGNDD